MRLYIIRHADPDYKNNTITPDGHMEAEALARRLKRYNISKIYSSPLGRAIDTMDYTSKLLDIQPEILDWTRELKLGIKESPWPIECAWDVPGEYLLDENLKGNDWYTAKYLCDAPIQETLEEITIQSDRFLTALGYIRQGLKYQIVKPNEDQVAVFCHGGFGITWISHLLNIPLRVVWSSFWLAPSSVTTILFDERTKGWAVPRCISLGDTSHLYESSIEIKPRGIKANFY